ncbi:Prophage antirepressor [Caminicella sporogenes DSM 14501]|uniref:Prophage antirepressor n=1 Tax=Caminicella sporogenes DSM 14501 TaxID=1121266 RepID=A0A1M6RH22_9FIRM|nr:BRO family protein [Caminicella sporogenes]RKD25231.1 BRO family protein [Caminicella sporogenes]SHK31742.1 Prophage antirepressor [Caminicella sporogenes DSM 14501]
MNQLKIFKNTEFGELNILVIEDKEYFPATECARMLGYSNPHKAVINHCRYLTKREVPHPQNINKKIEMNFIPEGDLYRLIVGASSQSKNKEVKEKAERFEKWIFDEVLPSIRKHGIYAADKVIEEMLNNPDTMIKTLQALKEERKKIQELTEKVEEQDKKLQLFRNLQRLNEMLRASDIGMYYGITAKEFNRIMQDAGVIKKVDNNFYGRNSYYVMTAKYSHTRYCQVITDTLKNGMKIKTNVWLPESLEFIDSIMQEYGYKVDI